MNNNHLSVGLLSLILLFFLISSTLVVAAEHEALPNNHNNDDHENNHDAHRVNVVNQIHQDMFAEAARQDLHSVAVIPQSAPKAI